MLRTNTTSTNPSSDATQAKDSNGFARQKTAPRHSDLDVLDRIARLVADGELPLPQDLATEDFDWLVKKVRKLRRRRLVRFIARAIAFDIWQSQ